MSKAIFLIFKIILQTFIEIIFPCFCVGCGKKNTLLCCNCYEQIEFHSFSFNKKRQIKYVDEIITVCKYKGVIRKLIHEFKYKSVINIGEIIARLIYRSSNLPKCDLLIPVPIHKNKKGNRGFNQSEEISKKLSVLTKIPTINLLVKSKKTKSQMLIKNRDERKINLKNSFEINQYLLEKLQKKIKPNSLANKSFTIILIDDVITTGSTLDECAKILKSHGVKKVIGLALASR